MFLWLVKVWSRKWPEMSLESREGKIMNCALVVTIFSSCWACGGLHLFEARHSCRTCSANKVLGEATPVTTGGSSWHWVCSRVLFPTLERLVKLQRMETPADSTCLGPWPVTVTVAPLTWEGHEAWTSHNYWFSCDIEVWGLLPCWR